MDELRAQYDKVVVLQDVENWLDSVQGSSQCSCDSMHYVYIHICKLKTTTLKESIGDNNTTWQFGGDELDENGKALVAILHGEAVGIISMAAAEGDCGRILGMGLKPEMEGRYYGDQLLGCAFSYFRELGCTDLAIDPGYYPDDIVTRYEFDPVTRIRNIDTGVFNWEE